MSDETPGTTTDATPAPPGAENDTEESSPEAEEPLLAAGRWTEEFLDLARGHEIHRVPYGDLDVAAADAVEPTCSTTPWLWATPRCGPTT